MNEESWPGCKVLVTGASGWIGSLLCLALHRLGAEVFGLSRSAQRSDSVVWHRGDVADIDTVRSVVSKVKPDVIYHLASDTRGARELEMVPITFRANLASAVNILTCATQANCRRIVIAGSQEEPSTDMRGATLSSPYAAAKWCATQYGSMFRALYDAPVVNLRIFMIYGPRQMDLQKLVPSVILTLLRGEPPSINSGSRGVDWIFCDDVVNALLIAGSKDGIEGTRVDVGSGELVTIREIVDLLVEKIDPSVKAIYRNRQRRLEQTVAADPADTLRLIGWRPKVGLSDGLDRTIDWYRTHRAYSIGT